MGISIINQNPIFFLYFWDNNIFVKIDLKMRLNNIILLCTLRSCKVNSGTLVKLLTL